MSKVVGFIGCGNMAQAIIGGMVTSETIKPNHIIASNRSQDKLIEAVRKFGVEQAETNVEVAKKADILFLSIKPDQYDSVITGIKNDVKKDVVIVTIAAGISIKFIEDAFYQPIKVIRTMPNTPALVGEGMTALCANPLVEDEDLNYVIDLLESIGEVERIDESLMDFVPSISGSSPAYVFMLIEALADGGVFGGFPRNKAYKMAAQAVMGAAKMVLQTDLHPGILKDQVSSPGGATIEAIYSLEKSNFRGAIISAMESCNRKSIAMSQQEKNN